jgi:pimeloyl-ACP methyl ester carboxylesterase
MVEHAVRLRTGGQPGPVLLLLHGLGATSEVWDGLLAEADRHWPGRWLAPDLPGHGGSAPLDQYTFTSMAAALAAALAATLDAEPVTILGHSLGGVLALELASGRHGITPAGVVGVGIKIDWTAEELDRAAALARRPVATFPTEGAAIDRHLKVAGLTGLVPPEDPRARAGVRATRTGGGSPSTRRPSASAHPTCPPSSPPPAARCCSRRGSATRWSTRPSSARSHPAPPCCPASGTTRTSRTRPWSVGCSPHGRIQKTGSADAKEAR